MKKVRLLQTCVLFFWLLAAACSPGAVAPPVAPATSAVGEESEAVSWQLESIGQLGNTFDVMRIAMVNNDALPIAARQYTFDLLIVGSGAGQDYGSEPLNDFYDDVKPFVRDVFGNANAHGNSAYSTPFSYYVTDYEYPGPTPTDSASCNPGLPSSWAPAQNTPVADMPAWDCNIALSTASVSLNLGMIVHRESVQDRSKYNLFSSEYNSYAAILHELSHAAYVMSDEAEAMGAGRFRPVHHPNIYLNDSTCAGDCPSSCMRIGVSVWYRCQPADDSTNLMFFFPQPTPGANDGWDAYELKFASQDRLQYLHAECNRGRC